MEEHEPDLEEKNDHSHKLTRSESSNLIQDVDLSEEKAELLVSRLQQWHIL